RSVTSAVHSEQRSAPLVAASTTEQEIQRVCTGATSDGAALEDSYPVQAESNGVEKELEPLQHSVPDARESSGARVNGDSAQDDEGPGSRSGEIWQGTGEVLGWQSGR
ncbi:hypothetical protein JG687_00010808, partial [Phytophthora cactorum]